MPKEWKKIKNFVLGEKYDLSVVFGDPTLMRKLNKTYRSKNKIANVLSFTLTKSVGEIFINKKYEKQKEYATYLFIHSLLHLKGLDHGAKMDKEEEILIKKFNIKTWPET